MTDCELAEIGEKYQEVKIELTTNERIRLHFETIFYMLFWM
jgi:hypothetical protein